VRALADAARIRGFMQGLAQAASHEGRVYFTGGATAVLLGWRPTTIDVDVRFVPEHDELFRAVPALKEKLQLNVELASPPDFIPVQPGWEERGAFIEHIGRLGFYHFDFYAQALAKVERGHVQDMADVGEMLRRGLVEPTQARTYFAAIEPRLYRYPAIDAASYRRKVEAAFGKTS
jgi:hypothetical protein